MTVEMISSQILGKSSLTGHVSHIRTFYWALVKEFVVRTLFRVVIIDEVRRNI